MSQATPKKPASRRGRINQKKQQRLTIADCAVVWNFKPGWITTENIFTAPQRKGKTLPMLAEVFRELLERGGS